MKIITAVNYFRKMLHRRCLTVLNMSRILNMPEFSIYRGSEYSRVLNMLLVLNMSGFSLYHGSKYPRVTQASEYA